VAHQPERLAMPLEQRHDPGLLAVGPAFHDQTFVHNNG